jgi:hypothetical protein
MSVPKRIFGEQSANDWIRGATGANSEKSQACVTWLFFVHLIRPENSSIPMLTWVLTNGEKLAEFSIINEN